jgi:nucleotide-binding universal stress UspA family protein
MDKLQPERILCPTDFSDMAAFALQYAKVVAEGFQARLIVLYAETFEPPPYFTSDQQRNLLKSLARSHKAAERHLSRYVDSQVGEALQAETLVVEGPPFRAILKAVQDRQVDWIVMGTQGQGGWKQLVMGSVTARVLAETDCPVLAVRYKKGAAEPYRVSIQRVLCPVNYTDIALKALHQAVAVVERFSAQLLIVHVLESPGEETEERAMDRLCSWIPEDIRSRCQMEEMIRKGNAAEQVLEAAASSDCDMMVVGAQHKRFWDTTVIGTTTMNVIGHAPCPVLTVVSKRIEHSSSGTD